MRRLGEDLQSRYFVVNRETLYQSPVALTPYLDEVRIDERALGELIDQAYACAGLHPDNIDTGSVILTGEALRRENAQAIGEMLAELGGEFVCATAGHHMEAMHDGAIVANSGHFNDEINIKALTSMAEGSRQVRPFVEEYRLGDGRRIFLLGEGRLINLAAAEGHPAAVMDMSFANQALCVEHVVNSQGKLEPHVYPVPEEIDADIARLKLASMGISIDVLTDEQKEYLSSWESGT